MHKAGTELENLRLSFYENKELTKDVFDEFMNALHKNHKLKKLDLNLRRLSQVNNEWLESLAHGMEGSELEEVELWLWHCWKVDDHGFEKVLDALEKQKNLKSLKVYYL